MVRNSSPVARRPHSAEYGRVASAVRWRRVVMGIAFLSLIVLHFCPRAGVHRSASASEPSSLSDMLDRTMALCRHFGDARHRYRWRRANIVDGDIELIKAALDAGTSTPRIWPAPFFDSFFQRLFQEEGVGEMDFAIEAIAKPGLRYQASQSWSTFSGWPLSSRAGTRPPDQRLMYPGGEVEYLPLSPPSQDAARLFGGPRRISWMVSDALLANVASWIVDARSKVPVAAPVTLTENQLRETRTAAVSVGSSEMRTTLSLTEDLRSQSPLRVSVLRNPAPVDGAVAKAVTLWTGLHDVTDSRRVESFAVLWEREGRGQFVLVDTHEVEPAGEPPAVQLDASSSVVDEVGGEMYLARNFESWPAAVRTRFALAGPGKFRDVPTEPVRTLAASDSREFLPWAFGLGTLLVVIGVGLATWRRRGRASQ